MAGRQDIMKLFNLHTFIFIISAIVFVGGFGDGVVANDNDLKVVASVNGDVITSYDIKVRSDFMNKILDESDNDFYINRYNKQNIFANILDDIIKEKLKIAEAKKYGLNATEFDVKKAISFMDKSFNFPDGKIQKIMKQSGCSDRLYVRDNVDVCHQIFFAEVVWSKFSGMFFGALSGMNDQEVSDEMKKYKDYIDFVVSDLNISQIVLNDKKSADNFYDELKNSSVNDCKNFDSVAETRGVGGSGNLGYLKLQETSQVVGEHIKDLPVGVVSSPLKNADGLYYIYLICDKKIDEKLKDKVPSFEEMQDRISNAMVSKKIEGFAIKYLEKLFNTAFIEYM